MWNHQRVHDFTRSYGDFLVWTWWSKDVASGDDNRMIHVILQLWFLPGWWFETFFILPYIGNNNANWLIFFRGVETTKQWWLRNPAPPKGWKESQWGYINHLSSQCRVCCTHPSVDYLVIYGSKFEPYLYVFIDFVIPSSEVLQPYSHIFTIFSDSIIRGFETIKHPLYHGSMIHRCFIRTPKRGPSVRGITSESSATVPHNDLSSTGQHHYTVRAMGHGY